MATPSEVDAQIQAILAREEFRGAVDQQGREVEVIGELFRSILAAIQALVGDLRSNHPGLFVATLILGVLVLAVAVALGARGASRRRQRDLSLQGQRPEALRGDHRTLRSQAQAEAAAGHYLEAVRLQFRAVIIEQAVAEGVLEGLQDAERFRRARTYRELAAEFRRDAGRGSDGGLERVAARLELGLYAGVALGPRDWEEARALGGPG